MTDDEILEFVASLLTDAVRYQGHSSVPASLTRDETDAKFLALAEESSAEYLVSNDRRHLCRLGRYKHTKIVTPAQFLRELS